MANLIRKAIAAPAGDDPMTYVLSDESIDRVGDVIEAKGWKLGNFLKNPVALFGHDHKFIVGHWTEVKVLGGKLIGKLNLLPAGISERLDEIRAAVEAGVLRAVSVGFAADDAEPMKTGGLRFKSTELLEASLVSVPANPNALQVAKALHLSDDVQALIFEEEVPAAIEIPSEPEKPAPESKKAVVVRLGTAAQDRAPFVINKIHPRKP